MSLFSLLIRRKQPEAPFDPYPEKIDYMPARPYLVLYADVPFFSDPECRIEVRDARLVVLQCEDRRQKQRPIECMPTLKKYRQGQWVLWEINHKRQWERAWFVDPGTGQKTLAWALAVEFLGKVVNETVAASTAESEAR